MLSSLVEELGWLPPVPADFRTRLRAVDCHEAPGRELQALASHRLAASDLKRLAGALADLAGAGRGLAPLVPFKLGLLGNGTLDLLVPSLVGSALRHGIALEVVTAPYGLYAQQILDPGSAVNQAKCDAVLLALDHRALRADGAGSPREALELVDGLRQAIGRHGGATCIFQTLAAPPENLFGSAERRMVSTARHFVDAFNRELIAQLDGTSSIVLDVASLAETIGLARWHCPAQWNLAKLPFAAAYIPIYADHVGRLLGALRGKSRRCLVLDLDNTLWGGVVGDDGLQGIDLAEGSAVGEAFRAVQRFALDLRQRGVLLAVCSKNDDEIARQVFRAHPEMLLREKHVTVFQANWNDKASNIKAISEELSLGLDSFVFLDDNPAERGLVRQMLPEVAVPELPADPAYYTRTLAAAGYFESLSLSEEDLQRAEFYERNAQRIALKNSFGDIQAYYASLAMKIHFAPFDQTGRSRIVQLINKSNQFNLTTRRYSEAEVAALEGDAACFTLQVRLTDVFGDNGMISVVICRPDSPQTWAIDSWLMSCRVLGRNVEHMVLRELIARAGERGISRLTGRYVPSGRNEMVRDHYAKLGFTPGECAGDWFLDVTPSEPMPMPQITATREAPAL